MLLSYQKLITRLIKEVTMAGQKISAKQQQILDFIKDEILKKGYELADTEPRFGQNATTLLLLKRREAGK